MEALIVNTSSVMNEDGTINFPNMWHELSNLCHKLAENWFIRQCQNPQEYFYFYFKETDEANNPGELAVFNDNDDIPEGFNLVNAEYIYRSFTVEQAAQRFFDSIGGLSILPVAKQN